MSLGVAEPRTTTSKRPAAAEELALFHRTLAELCRTDVPLPRALRLLHEDMGTGHLGAVAADMAAEVEDGIPLQEAYASRKQLFPELYRALIEAGMASSDLPGVLEEIAAHAAAEAQIKARIGAALRYPIYALVVVVLIGAALVTFLPPILTGILDPRSQVFWSSDVVKIFRGTYTLTLKDYLTLLPWAGLGLLALVGLFLLVFAALRRPLEGTGPRSFWFRLPVLGRLRTYAARASFASTLALLARRKMPLPRMLTLAAATADHAVTREHIRQMLGHAEAGESLSQSIRAGNLISPGLLFLLQSAERSATVPEALAEVARIYRQRLDRATDRLCTLVRPTAEILLGLVVMAFALAYMFPALQFVDGIFGW